MKNYTFLIIALFITNTVFAHTGSIQGSVIDAKSKSPLEFASITIPSINVAASTNLSGTFIFSDLEEGIYTLEISCIGHAKKTVQVEVNEAVNEYINITLEPTATLLKEVTVQTDQIANTNTISKRDIGLRPISTSQDVLRMVPGLFIAQHAGGGKAEQIFLRGFDCDHGTDIAVSVDAMPVNMVSHAHGQGYADLHFLIPETVERVNVRKGPYNASIGNFATAGAVQFQTKNIIDQNMVSIEAGRFNMLRGFATLNLLGKKAQENNQHLYVAGEYFYRQGFFDSPDNLHRYNVFAKYYGLLGKHHRVTAQFSNFDSKWNASGQIPERAVTNGSISRFGSIDPTEGGQTGRMNASLKVESNLHNGNVLRNQVFYNTYDFNLFSNFTFYKNDTTNGDKIRQHENRQILGYNGAYFNQRRFGKMAVSSEIGIQIRYDQIKNNELSNVAINNDVLQRFALGDVNELNVAAYINQNIDLHPKFRINMGLREDFFSFDYKDQLNSTKMPSVQKARFSPKLNLYYAAHKNVQLFLLSGVGFHSNDTRVVVAQKGFQTLPPAYGVEIGTNYKPNKNLLVTASLWALYMQQEFMYVGDEAVVEPSGKTQRVGIDIGARYDITNWLFADIDFNYALPRALQVPSEENKIPLAPTLTSIGGLTAKLPLGFNASLRYRYLADRAANESNTLTAKGYLLSDAVIEYTHKKLVFGLSAENLFNSAWKEAQFETESQLKDETAPISEIHFTAGTPLFIKGKLGIRF